MTPSPTDSTWLDHPSMNMRVGNVMAATHDASALVSEDNREQALIVCRKSRGELQKTGSRRTSGSLPLRVYSSVWQIPMRASARCAHTGAGTRTGVKDVDADFVGAGRGDLDLLELEGLASAPADGGFAGDGLSDGGHDGKEREGGTDG